MIQRRIFLLFTAFFLLAAPCSFADGTNPYVLPLKIMSYNIRHGAGIDDVFDLDRTAGVINKQAPDIVGLQEVDSAGNRSKKIDETAYLAKAGVDVLLLDKEIFPRDKACGDMITEKFVRHANQLEITDRLDKMSVFVNQLLMVSDGGREALVPYECYGTKRRELDQLLVETAVNWGAEFRPGCRVTGLIHELGKVCGVKVLTGGAETEIRAKVVIGADGALSIVAKEAGLMREAAGAMSIGMSAYFEGVRLDRNIAIGQYSAYGAVFFDRTFAPGYLWILPSGDGGVLRGYCNVGMVVDYADGSRKSHRNLEQRFEDWLSRSTRAAMRCSCSAVSFTVIPMTHVR